MAGELTSLYLSRRIGFVTDGGVVPPDPDPLPKPPTGYAYVTDKSGKFLLWKRTAYSEPSYLLTRIN